jgi:hypothetical protein
MHFSRYSSTDENERNGITRTCVMIGSDRIGSDRIGSDRIGSDRIGSGGEFSTHFFTKTTVVLITFRCISDLLLRIELLKLGCAYTLEYYFCNTKLVRNFLEVTGECLHYCLHISLR